MHSIVFKGKVLKTERDVKRAAYFCKSKAESDELFMKLNACDEVDAMRRYEQEKDPYIKNQMRHFINVGNYNFDRLFGKE